MKCAVFPLLLFAAVLPSSGLAQQAPAASRTQQVYVSVVDGKGAPVTGLTTRDFTVREDGVTREVLRVEPATEPIDVTVIVDDSQAATTLIPHLRDGLARFVDALQGKARIGIVTIGERPTSLISTSTDAAALKKAINRIFARPGSGTYLLEGIRDVSRGIQKRDTKRPVILVVTAEGVEFSNLQHERVLEELWASGAALHVLAIGTPAGSMSDEMRNRNVVIAEGTEKSGGRRDQLLAAMALEDRLVQVAGELVNQYVVAYGRPDALVPPTKLQVTTTKSGANARARSRLAGK